MPTMRTTHHAVKAPPQAPARARIPTSVLKTPTTLAPQGGPHVWSSLISPVDLFKLIGFIFVIDKVEPVVPIENRPVQLDFSVSNYTGRDTSGKVTCPLGGEFDITHLANGSTVTGSVTSVAPRAGRAAEFLLEFYEADGPIVAEIRQPSAIATTDVGVAARFTLTLESFEITNTRALHEDTDYISLAAQVGDQQPVHQTQFVGDVNNGIHPVRIRLNPFDIVPEGSQDLNFSYLIVNSGYAKSHEKDAEAVSDTISDLTQAVLTILYPSWSAAWTVANALTHWLNHVFGADCDGLVAADQVMVPSGLLDTWTKANGRHRERRYYPGTDSAVGCGSNSEYYVTWSIDRMLHD